MSVARNCSIEGVQGVVQSVYNCNFICDRPISCGLWVLLSLIVRLVIDRLGLLDTHTQRFFVPGNSVCAGSLGNELNLREFCISQILSFLELVLLSWCCEEHNVFAFSLYPGTTFITFGEAGAAAGGHLILQFSFCLVLDRVFRDVWL